MPPKRRIFVSFDHDDTEQVNGFLDRRNILDSFEFYNHKLDRILEKGIVVGVRARVVLAGVDLGIG